MKKGVLLIIIFLVSIQIIDSDELKVETKVINELSINEEVPVIVKVSGASEDVIRKFSGNEIKEAEQFSIVNGFSGIVDSSDIEKLKRDANVESIEYDYKVHAFLQDSLYLINATQAHNTIAISSNITGVGETICIIDTGINYTHPDLSGKLLDGHCYASGGNCPDGSSDQDGNDSINDDNGHGTHVAGIAAANGTLTGVAPDAKFIAIKVLDENGSGFTSDVVRGIEWCTNNASAYNIGVISMSLGSGSFASYCDDSQTSYRDAINAAIAQNITVVAAAGNDGNSAAIASPACIENATAVSALDKDNAIASYSSRSNITDFFAPGTLINSTVPAAANCITSTTCADSLYRALSGTSMAAPHVAASFLLLRQYKLEENSTILTPSEMSELLANSGTSFTEGSNAFKKINIYAALSMADALEPGLAGDSIQPAGTVFNTTNVTLTVNVTDSFIETVWLESNFEGNLSNYTILGIESQYNYTIDSLNLSVNDNITWQFYANDSSNNLNQTIQHSFIVSEPMALALNSPANNSFLNSEAVTFNFTVTDDIDPSLTCSLNLNNNFNASVNAASNQETLIEANLSEQLHYWDVNCTDSDNNLILSDTNAITVDLTAPAVMLESPGNDTDVSSASLDFNFTVIDDNPDICTLYSDINGTFIDNETVSANNNTLSNITINNIADGAYNWNVLCIDKAGNSAFNDTNFTFSLDSNAPVIVISSPLNITYGAESIDLNYSATDINLDSVWYSIDSNISLTENITLNLSESSYNLRLYANDSLGHEAVSSLEFRIDLTSPGITLISPSNNSVSSSSSVTFEYNVTDAAIANCSLVFDSLMEQTDSSVSVNEVQSFTKGSVSNAAYTWSIECADEANNINSSESFRLTISVSESSGGGGSSGGGSSSGGSSSSADTAAAQSIEIKPNPILIPETTQNEAANTGSGITLSHESKSVKIEGKSEGDTIQLMINDNEHKLTINELTETTATITIESEPITVTLNVGGIAEIDTDNDKANDLSIKLESIIDKKASFTISIIEAVTVNEFQQSPISGFITRYIINQKTLTGFFIFILVSGMIGFYIFIRRT
jgi:subtilisin family serine protease